MTKEQLIEALQDLPDGTEVYFRRGDRAEAIRISVLSDDKNNYKLTAYISSFCQDYPSMDVATFGWPYPEHHREVCVHGRSMMGPCTSCDFSDDDEVDPVDLENICEEVLEENPRLVALYHAGKTALGPLVGLTIKKLADANKGMPNPLNLYKLVQGLLETAHKPVDSSGIENG